jgi:hypothetical protein
MSRTVALQAGLAIQLHARQQHRRRKALPAEAPVRPLEGMRAVGHRGGDHPLRFLRRRLAIRLCLSHLHAASLVAMKERAIRAIAYTQGR